MSTNYFWKIKEPDTVRLPTGELIRFPLDLTNPKIHIGKRWSVGAWCFKCDRTLCTKGVEGIDRARDTDWYHACPSCGTSRMQGAKLRAPESSGAPPTEGLFRAWGFTWAQDPGVVRGICETFPDTTVIMDEQNQHYTGREFLATLRYCKVHDISLLGEYFD